MLIGINFLKIGVSFLLIVFQLVNVYGYENEEKAAFKLKRFQDEAILSDAFNYNLENLVKSLVYSTQNKKREEEKFKEILKHILQKRIQKEKSDYFWKLRQG